MVELLRKGHFLGAKLRSVRKRHGLTLEELSLRCMERNADLAPSVSYLSMIESGKRMPSSALLQLLAGVFQRSPAWFLDESAELEQPLAASPGGAAARPAQGKPRKEIRPRRPRAGRRPGSRGSGWPPGAR